MGLILVLVDFRLLRMTADLRFTLRLIVRYDALQKSEMELKALIMSRTKKSLYKFDTEQTVFGTNLEYTLHLIVINLCKYAQTVFYYRIHS